MTRPTTRDILLFSALVATAVASRLLPHAPNFTALIAVGLLAAAVFPRLIAAAVPLTAMLISDAVIGGYDARLMLAVYASMLLPLALRPLLRGRLPILRAASLSVLCSILFFTFTNAAVWAFGSMYDPTPAGLAACFAAALPFFKFQLAGDLLYTLTLFTLAAAIPALAHPAPAQRPALATA
jgi:hypothetical protein